MAEIQMADARGGARRKRANLRVDLTPMVDLGFLLIAFFMYTTTLARPAVIELTVPPRQPDSLAGTPISASSALILLPTAHHRIAWYRGTDDPMHDLHVCSGSGSGGLRSLLEAETKRVARLPATLRKSAHQLHVLIKPDDSAAYDDVIRALDEMQIGAVSYYSVMRPDGAELQALRGQPAARH